MRLKKYMELRSTEDGLAQFEQEVGGGASPNVNWAYMVGVYQGMLDELIEFAGPDIVRDLIEAKEAMAARSRFLRSRR